MNNAIKVFYFITVKFSIIYVECNNIQYQKSTKNLTNFGVVFIIE